MKTDGLFTKHECHIPKWKIGRTLRLIPFGDVHFGAPGHSEKEWKKFLDYAKSIPDAYYLGMGDFTDAWSASERIILSDDGIHESTLAQFEAQGMLMIDTLASQLSFMRGRLVGLLGGNHFLHFQDGTTGDQHLARKLGCAYLGVCSAIRLSLGIGTSKTMAIDIFAHHGRGAGRTAGGRMNSVEHLAEIAIADIYLMGDNHARGALPLGDKLYLASHGGNLTLQSRRQWIGRTGSFLRAYEPGQRGYVVDRALPPSSLGWIEFEITPIRELANGSDRIYIEIKSRQ